MRYRLYDSQKAEPCQVNTSRQQLVIQGSNRYIFSQNERNALREVAVKELTNILIGAVLAASLLMGCSSGSQVAKVGVPADSLDSPARQQALRHLITGSAPEAKGDHAAAILEYQDALRYSRDPALYFAISKGYSALSKHSLAIEAGKEAVRLAPNEITYHQNMADVYAAAFDFEAAASEFEEIIRRDSTDLNAWFNLAHLLQNKRPLRAPRGVLST